MKLLGYGAILLIGITAVGCLQTKEMFKNAKAKSSSQISGGGEKVKCQNYLLKIGGAKTQWAKDKNKTTGDVPTWEDLVGPKAYLPVTPTCPAGGTYVIGAIGTDPSCSLSNQTDFPHTYPK